MTKLALLYTYDLTLSLSCSKLCMEEMTCFEPEACCQLISGMDFHKFYFEKCVLPTAVLVLTLQLPPCLSSLISHSFSSSLTSSVYLLPPLSSTPLLPPLSPLSHPSPLFFSLFPSSSSSFSSHPPPPSACNSGSLNPTVDGDSKGPHAWRERCLHCIYSANPDHQPVSPSLHI